MPQAENQKQRQAYFEDWNNPDQSSNLDHSKVAQKKIWDRKKELKCCFWLVLSFNFKFDGKIVPTFAFSIFIILFIPDHSIILNVTCQIAIDKYIFKHGNQVLKCLEMTSDFLCFYCWCLRVICLVASFWQKVFPPFL